jgi:hypothetical protein
MRAGLKIGLSLLTLLLSVLLVGVITAAAAPYGSQTYDPNAPGMRSWDSQSYEPSYALRGTVLSVDPDSKAVTVKPMDRDITSTQIFQGTVTLGTDENTKVMMCNYGTSFGDIKAGEKVNVFYHGQIGSIVADDIRAAEC